MTAVDPLSELRQDENVDPGVPDPGVPDPGVPTETLNDGDLDVQLARVLGWMAGDPMDATRLPNQRSPEEGGEGLTSDDLAGLTRTVEPPEPGVPPQTLGGDNWQSGSFAHDLLAFVGVPITFENVIAINAWVRAEGTNAKFNPLATTQTAPGSWGFNDNNGYPVQNFTSYDQGLKAIAKTLTNGKYGNILAALARGTDAMGVGQAIDNSPWGTGGLVLTIIREQLL